MWVCEPDVSIKTTGIAVVEVFALQENKNTGPLMASCYSMEPCCCFSLDPANRLPAEEWKFISEP
jgi:hypothetical protein